MGLGTTVRLARYGSWGAAALTFLAGATAAATPHYSLAIPIGLLLYGGQQSWSFFTRRALEDMMALSTHERFDEADALLAEVEELYPLTHANVALFQLYRATLLLGRGRALEAVALLDATNASALASTYRAWRLNNLAWALVEAGDAARALAVAKESAGDVDAPTSELGADGRTLRGSQLGTLGAAYVLAGQPEEALPLLERALGFGGRPATRAARSLWLGRAAHALGRHDEAVKAWKEAAAIIPPCRFTRQAADALKMLAQGPIEDWRVIHNVVWISP